MIELGFIPFSKQGELERISACQNAYCTIKVVPPKLQGVPLRGQRSQHDFLSIFRCSCYTACSDMGHVVNRGNDAVAATQASHGNWDFVVKSKLLLLMKSYPSFLAGLPMGIRMTVGFLTCVMKTGAVGCCIAQGRCLLFVASGCTFDGGLILFAHADSSRFWTNGAHRSLSIPGWWYRRHRQPVV